MSEPLETQSLPYAAQQQIDRTCDEFEAAWRSGERPRIDAFLAGTNSERSLLLRELLRIDVAYRRRNGEKPAPEVYAEILPDDRSLVEAVLYETRRMTDPTPASRSKCARSEAPDPHLTLPAQSFPRLGDYDLLEEIARGGMGVVYKARHRRLNRIVALKRILSGQFAGPEDVQRFCSEAEAAAQLEHAGIVPIYEIGEHQGEHFFTMAYVAGSSLAAKLKDGSLPPRQAADLVQKIAEAVHYAHQQGIVHRDLKPHNILLDRNGQPKVTDFGLAKWAQGDSGLTATGVVLGTPAYMPPEQAAGRRNVGPASDVYSLGAILYHALTGRPPFQAGTALEMLRKVAEQEPVPPTRLNAEIPHSLEAIVLKCLCKTPEQRYAAAADLAADLQRWLANEPISLPEGWAPDAASRLLVFLFTDLVDSSALKVELGDADYVTHIARPHNRIFRDLLRHFPGAVERVCTGDGFFATFESVADSVVFALQFHHRLRTNSWQRRAPAVRVGIHLGETVVMEGAEPGTSQLAGYAPDMAARVSSLAQGGQTLLTRAAFDGARQYVKSHPACGDDPAPELQWLAHGRYMFKGSDESMEVFEVGAVGLAPLSPPPNSEKAKRFFSPDEEATLGWRPAIGLPIPHRPGWTLVEQLGVGGFGEVWLARNDRLKEDFRTFKFCFDNARLRSFKRELTFFRLLDHFANRDDVAQLFEVQIDRSPYYLEGKYYPEGNLHRWTNAHGGVVRISLKRRMELLAHVARSVAVAHSCGIIHKDLKPSNVLIDDDSDGPKPKISDFGIGVLADPKVLEQHAITGTGFTESVMLGNESSRSGTRLYAAPEYLAGSPASTNGDVYALGVMLYQLAIGDLYRPLATGWEEDLAKLRDVDPFTRELLREDIRQATYGDASRRLSAKELAHRLSTMDERRAERVAAARAEAERQEVKRRADRRIRRMRVSVAALAVTALLAAIALLSARLDYEKQLKHQQKQIAAQQQQLASKNLVTATELLNEFAALGDAMPHYGGLDEPRRALYEYAASRVESLIESQADHPELHRMAAMLRLRLGDAYAELANPEKAAANYVLAKNVFAGLASDSPADTDHPDGVAKSLVRLGFLHQEAQDTAQAETHYQQAAKYIEEHRLTEGATAANLARLRSELSRGAGDHHAAESLARQAVNLLTPICDDAGQQQYLTDLAHAHNALGGALRDQGKIIESLEAHEEAMRIFERLAGAIGVQAADGMAATCNHRASCLWLLNRWDEYQQTLEAEQTLHEYLLQRRGLPEDQRKAVATATRLAQLSHKRRANLDAEQVLLALADTLERLPPDELVYDHVRAFRHLVLGKTQSDLGRAEAEQSLRAALQLYEAIVERTGGASNSPFLADVAISRSAYAGWLHRELHFDEARRTFAQAIEAMELLVAENPHSLADRDDLAAMRHHLAELLWDAGDQERAREQFAAGMKQRERLIRDHPDAHLYHYRLAETFVACDDPSLRAPQRAVELLKPLAENAAGGDQVRCRAMLSAAYYRLKDYKSAQANLPVVQDEIRYEEQALAALLNVLLKRGLPPDDAGPNLEAALAWIRVNAPHCRLLASLADEAKYLDSTGLGN